MSLTHAKNETADRAITQFLSFYRAPERAPAREPEHEPGRKPVRAPVRAPVREPVGVTCKLRLRCPYN